MSLVIICIRNVVCPFLYSQVKSIIMRAPSSAPLAFESCRPIRPTCTYRKRVCANFGLDTYGALGRPMNGSHTQCVLRVVCARRVQMRHFYCVSRVRVRVCVVQFGPERVFIWNDTYPQKCRNLYEPS